MFLYQSSNKVLTFYFRRRNSKGKDYAGQSPRHMTFFSNVSKQVKDVRFVFPFTTFQVTSTWVSVSINNKDH